MQRHRSASIHSVLLVLLLGLLVYGAFPVWAQRRGNPAPNLVSPVRLIERVGRPQRRPPLLSAVFRSFEGQGNNLSFPEVGSSFSPLLRLLPASYADGVSTMAGAQRAGAREISNIVFAQEGSLPNRLGATDFLWQWGQFLDHDIDLTDGTNPPEAAPIPVPIGDIWFDPASTGDAAIQLNRSLYAADSGSDAGNPRQQINEISAWIDASNVYGSDPERARMLRTNDGSGRLKTSPGGLLPFNTEGLPNAGGSTSALFLAGDVRANEQVALTALHTLFVREHNRLADRFRRLHPEWSGEQVYQRARQMVGAQMQVITYREYLPALLGRDALPRYAGYQPGINASIANSFSTAAYRYGHSALSSTIRRLDGRGNEIAEGSLQLREAFFAPQRIIQEGGIAPILRGLASQLCQRVDTFVVDDVRNFLFGEPGQGGFDLAALNIQRGRDHGLPSYNDTRQGLGLGRVRGFSQISSDPEVGVRLRQAYATVDDIDLWVGGLAEDALPGSHLGELFTAIVVDQFTALREGDRYWYARVLNDEERQQVERTRLSDIIRRNTNIGREIQDNVFQLR